MGRISEISYPYIFAIICGTVVYIYKWDISDVNDFDLILSATITVSSIIIAFLGTMISILITLTNSEVMKRIKENNAQNILTSYISQAIVAGFVLAVYSMVLFMFSAYEGEYANILLTAFVLFLSFLVFSSYRVLNLNSKILKSILNEQKQEGQASSMVRPSMNRKGQQ